MASHKARVAVFISGNGTDLQALIDASTAGKLEAEIALVVSSKPDAYGLVRASNERIESFVYKMKDYSSPQEAGHDLLRKLKERSIDYIATAGYLKLLPVEVIREYHNKVVNIHPALLPKFGGKGMYGQKVHAAVIEAGEKESGVTVHLADEVYDNGKILEQVRVPVLENDTPESLALRVLAEEHKLFPIVLNKLIKGEYKL
jgi:phosphoribosylglycinamide formyltransferase 1